MGISLQASTRPSNVPQLHKNYIQSGNKIVTPDNINRTFKWGEHGEIEMRPMEDMSQSTLTPGGPQPVQQLQQQPAQPEGPPDPYRMWAQQTTDAVKQQETLYQIGVAEATKKTRFKMQTLEREYDIKKDALEQEAKMAGPEQRDNYKKRFLALDTQYTIAAERLKDKDVPDLSELEVQNQKAIMQIQETAKEKKIILDTYKRLSDTGELDPKESFRLQLNELGMNVTRSDMQPPNPQQELREIEFYLKQFEDKMNISKQTMEGFGEKFLSPEEQEMRRALKKRHREILLLRNPEMMGMINKPRLTDTAEDVIGSKGGTIGTMLRSHAGASKTVSKTLDATTARAILNEAGSDIELARQLAKSRGYEL